MRDKVIEELIEESKRSADEEFGKKLSENLSENNKLFRKKVKKVRGGEGDGGVRTRGEDGELVKSGIELKGKGYFEQLINEAEGEAVVTCMGIEAGRGRAPMQREIGRLEVQNAIERLKGGNAAGMDGITAEMLKYGGDAVVEWTLLICEQAWKKEEVPDDWKKAISVPLYKGKGSRNECNSCREIRLLSVPGKVYGRILIERLIEVTERKMSKEQGGFRKGKGCVDQIFAMKMLVEEYLGKDKVLYSAPMDLEKACDRVD